MMQPGLVVLSEGCCLSQTSPGSEDCGCGDDVLRAGLTFDGWAFLKRQAPRFSWRAGGPHGAGVRGSSRFSQPTLHRLGFPV